MQLSATEIHSPDEQGARPAALAAVLQAFKPDALYVPAQIDEEFFQHLRSMCQRGPDAAAADSNAVEDGADASVYNWPAPSEQPDWQQEEAPDDADEVLQLAATKHFKFVQVGLPALVPPHPFPSLLC